MALVTFLMLSKCLRHHGKALILNTTVIAFLIIYTLIGGFIFLHFEYNYAQFMKMNDTLAKKECIERTVEKLPRGRRSKCIHNARRENNLNNLKCVDCAQFSMKVMYSERRKDRNLRSSHETDFAHVIAEKCLTEAQATDPRLEWSFKTAALFGFGILTTLGIIIDMEKLNQEH
ncbi:hypothetical protein KIN20_003684 [Parelaphostrongylus tenuis]|uniref:Uncharacterized protein n=1 Tax=Parelaphostrongylus tenuis TaxID=148309 RepID=A0AAD5LXQ5_PARTN|nr:hypothetical protein KIN20_003684 [Parelaphostrongylus tenuis]